MNLKYNLLLNLNVEPKPAKLAIRSAFRDKSDKKVPYSTVEKVLANN